MINRTQCNACGGRLTDVFDMGSLPLANGLVSAGQLDQPCERYPLLVAECGKCSLVQLRSVVEPETLYQDYRFFTASSSPNAAYFAGVASWIKEHTKGPEVLEIGSNDGTLLAAIEHAGMQVTGVDPAPVQCEQARSKLTRGKVVCDYWGSRAAYSHKGRLFDVVVACNVLGHATDLDDFLGGIRRVIRTDGLLVVEVQYLTSLLAEAAFELMYHEHVSYFDEVSLATLLVRHGFKVLGWETTDSQCGTLRMWAIAMGGGVAPSPVGHDWTSFRDSVATRRAMLLDTIDDMHTAGRRVCFYGAPAKATQIANYCGLTADSIQFATDTTPAKIGCYIPGTRIPVVDRSHLDGTDAAIVTAWNHWPHIVEKEAGFVAAGGVLIYPTLRGLGDCDTRCHSVDDVIHA